jgi:hypothetical protein
MTTIPSIALANYIKVEFMVESKILNLLVSYNKTVDSDGISPLSFTCHSSLLPSCLIN